MAISVLLCDDHALLRAGLRALLAGERGIEVVGEAENGLAAVGQAVALRPDVALVDITMPELDGHRRRWDDPGRQRAARRAARPGGQSGRDARARLRQPLRLPRGVPVRARARERAAARVRGQRQRGGRDGARRAGADCYVEKVRVPERLDELVELARRR